MNEKRRKERTVYFNEEFKNLARTNYRIVAPDNIHELVLPSSKDLYSPITTRGFNKVFSELLKRSDITTQNPSSHTLRKTFARRVFDQRGADQFALDLVSVLLNHQSTEQTKEYLGLTEQLKKEAYLNINKI